MLLNIVIVIATVYYWYDGPCSGGLAYLRFCSSRPGSLPRSCASSGLVLILLLSLLLLLLLLLLSLSLLSSSLLLEELRRLLEEGALASSSPWGPLASLAAEIPGQAMCHATGSSLDLETPPSDREPAWVRPPSLQILALRIGRTGRNEQVARIIIPRVKI